MSKLKDVVKDTSDWYDNQSWWYKLWHSKNDDIYSAVKSARENEIANIVTSIQNFYSAIGKETDVGLQEIANDFASKNYSGMANSTFYGFVNGYDENGNATKGYSVNNMDYSKSLLDSYDTVEKHYRDLYNVYSSDYLLVQAAIDALKLREGDRNRWGQAFKYYTLSDGRNALEVYRLLTAEEQKALKGYATGGFPEDGLFFANHSELVGKFSNGKTAVANNAQIVEGIKRGVSEAMSESGGNDSGTWVIQIVDTDGNVKGEKIVTAAERKNRRDGKTVISVGG